MRELIKRCLIGTPLEGAARALYRALAGPSPPPPSPADVGAHYDAQTVAVIERVLGPRSPCIDVGCHEGIILDVMLRNAPAGDHYAFEPLPHLYAALVKKYSANRNVHLFEAALSDVEGRASFQHVVTNPGYSGLRKRRYDRPQEEVVETEVRLLRLDDVLPADLEIRFVKIDVEGAELQVLRGAERMLGRCRPFVVFEHGLGAADYYGTRPEVVFDLLTACGLRLSLMSDWLSSPGGRTLSREAFAAEFDNARNYYFMAHP